jgi:hypothetical protein
VGVAACGTSAAFGDVVGALGPELSRCVVGCGGVVPVLADPLFTQITSLGPAAATALLIEP